jgi:hypothetical protein
LTYPQTFAVADKASVSPDELSKNYIRVEALSRFYTKVNLFQSFMASLAVLFTSLMALPFFTYVIAGIYLAKGMPYPQTKDKKTQRPTKKYGDRFTPEERNLSSRSSVPCSPTQSFNVSLVHLIS